MKTNTHITTPPAKGFTLVEILTVMAIIAVLATMTIGGIGYYNDKAAKSKTLVVMGAIESALEQYHFDTGEYPPEAAENPLRSTKVLYQALYGDQDKDGIPDPGATVYLSMLNPNLRGKSLNLLFKDGKVIYVIVDGWGDRLGYRCIPEGAPELMNPPSSFDLWSAGNSGNVTARFKINNWE